MQTKVIFKGNFYLSFPCSNIVYVFLFGLRFYVPVNSYGHVETVSLSNHTFSQGKLV